MLPAGHRRVDVTARAEPEEILEGAPVRLDRVRGATKVGLEGQPSPRVRCLRYPWVALPPHLAHGLTGAGDTCPSSGAENA
jgi:hypothetical protein